VFKVKKCRMCPATFIMYVNMKSETNIKLSQEKVCEVPLRDQKVCEVLLNDKKIRKVSL
jgi:hypothetical protein